MSQLFWREFVRGYSSSVEVPQHSGKLQDFSRFATEIFHRLYYEKEPHYLDAIAPEHEWAKKLHELLSGNPEFDRMSTQSIGDAVAAGVGAINVAKYLLSTMPQPEEELKDLSELRDEVKRLKREAALSSDSELKEKLETDAEALIAEGKRKVEAAQEFADSIETGAMDFVLSQGVSQIEDDLDELRESMKLLGIPANAERSSLERQVPIDQAIRLAQALQKSPQLKQVLELAGKMVELARTKRRQAKSISICGELVGVTTGNDLGRTLPSELAKLNDSRTRSLFYKDFLEHSLLQYELEAPQPKGQGPIVIMADSTGSMEYGHRLTFSKALMVALSTLARQDERDFCILHWGDGVLRTDYFEPGNQSCSDQLLESIQYFRSDNINNEIEAFRGAVKIIESSHYKDADLIFLTDGGWGSGYWGDIYTDSEMWSQEFQQQREELQLSVYALLVENNESEVQEYVQPDLLVSVSQLLTTKDLNTLMTLI